MIVAAVAAALGRQVRAAWPVGGGDVSAAFRVELAGGEAVFAKADPHAPPGFFAAEAAGLRWLAEAGAPVPGVLASDERLLVTAWVEPGPASAAAAERLGRALARLHRSGAVAFGADWPGYIGTLPLDNTPAPDWPGFYAAQRLLPYAGALAAEDRRAVEAVCDRIGELAGPPEPPARIHGDLWSGNVHWAADGVARLVDPAAHGGHRETDLALLQLFGAPQLDRVLGAYRDEWPLADGWRERLPLHQLHPLLVHAAMFGGGYGPRAGAVARGLLQAVPR